VAERKFKTAPKAKAAPPPKAPPRPLALVLAPDTQFRRDVDRLRKTGKDLAKLETVLELLRTGRPLEKRHQDHPLKGEWIGFRDCHIEPDWVLIYKRQPGKLILARTGTHSELFK
jgi:mRNA interferase YafQ